MFIGFPCYHLQSNSSLNSDSSGKQVLMTRRQYTDPLGSDDEDDSVQSPNTVKQFSAPVTPSHRVLENIKK